MLKEDSLTTNAKFVQEETIQLADSIESGEDMGSLLSGLRGSALVSVVDQALAVERRRQRKLGKRKYGEFWKLLPYAQHS